jgi:hypothetical protein
MRGDVIDVPSPSSGRGTRPACGSGIECGLLLWPVWQHTAVADVRTSFAVATGMPLSIFDSANGLQSRDDVPGLNLATKPKVLIECGNMRNVTDAALLVTPALKAAAHALAQDLTSFLMGP